MPRTNAPPMLGARDIHLTKQECMIPIFDIGESLCIIVNETQTSARDSQLGTSQLSDMARGSGFEGVLLPTKG